MPTIDTVGAARQVRAAVAVQARFEGESFLVKDFTANLGVGGLFLLTDRPVPPRARGTLTFRASPFESPFVVGAEVVHVVQPGGTAPPGLGIQFLDLSPQDRERLRRLVEGGGPPSIAQVIRQEARSGPGGLSEELRRRTTDQKLMFAASAQPNEIEALIRDGNASVVQRLLEGPRLTQAHVQQILRDPRMPPAILAAIARSPQWLGDEAARALFCAHPSANLQEAQSRLQTLGAARLAALAQNADLRPQVRQRAKELLKRRGAGDSRG